ncbi:MAG: YceI family protein [Hyphomonadaceae bacterium]|jgi:cytochrome b561|nr:YceI family protein [Hyphomonadaceae bacterium]
MNRRQIVSAAALALTAGIMPGSLAGVQAQGAGAPAWTVTAAQSSISFATRWDGNPVTGTFPDWTADIRFDPRNLGASRVRVEVRTGSVRSGTREAVDNLPGPDWLASRAFPTVTYEASRFTALGGNRYRADGFITVKGVRHRLTLPFTLDIAGTTATMNGTAALNRLPLRIGVESDAAAEWVDRVTNVTVRVVATRR